MLNFTVSSIIPNHKLTEQAKARFGGAIPAIGSSFNARRTSIPATQGDIVHGPVSIQPSDGSGVHAVRMISGDMTPYGVSGGVLWALTGGSLATDTVNSITNAMQTTADVGVGVVSGFASGIGGAIRTIWNADIAGFKLGNVLLMLVGFAILVALIGWVGFRIPVASKISDNVMGGLNKLASKIA